MNLMKIWVCTSKSSKLSRIYLLQTGNTERELVFDCFKDDLNRRIIEDKSLDKINGNALIEDIPYYVDFNDINRDSYLNPFKEKVEEILYDDSQRIIQFSKNPMNLSKITNFDDKEGIKFIIAQSEESLYFLSAPNNSIIKNKSILSLDINQNSTVLKVDKGIQIPPMITAKFDCNNMRLSVYDVNRFESMLTLSENRKAKSKAVLDRFIAKEYLISSEGYTFTGLDSNEVQQNLYTSNRSIRRLSKYQPSQEKYPIRQIKEAVEKLDSNLRVTFDDDKQVINITPDTAKTFVGIIHNSIVQRLISGEVEIAI